MKADFGPLFFGACRNPRAWLSEKSAVSLLRIDSIVLTLHVARTLSVWVVRNVLPAIFLQSAARCGRSAEG
jgi:hypothetical protein